MTILAVVIGIYGEDTTLSCQLNSASYKWRKWNGYSFQDLSYSDRYSYLMETLTIHRTNIDDSGRYQCVLMNNNIESGSLTPIALKVQGLSSKQSIRYQLYIYFLHFLSFTLYFQIYTG